MPKLRRAINTLAAIRQGCSPRSGYRQTTGEDPLMHGTGSRTIVCNYDRFIEAANDWDGDEVEARARAWLKEDGG
jgi:hypothetical protein